jgi:hypothetical protein
MLCGPVVLCLLNCITETVQVTDGRKYFHGGPHVDQRWSKASLRSQHKSAALSKSFLIWRSW